MNPVLCIEGLLLLIVAMPDVFVREELLLEALLTLCCLLPEVPDYHFLEVDNFDIVSLIHTTKGWYQSFMAMCPIVSF
jgi:hypothetical protein